MLAEIFRNYVASGGGIADLVGLEDDVFYDLFGIKGLKSENPALIKTYRFDPTFLPGSEGYNPEKSASILSLLEEKTTREPIKWSEKEKIFEYVQGNFN